MPRKHSPTSKAAFDSVKDEREVIYSKIIEGLKKLRVGGTTAEIADSCGLQNAQVHKRVSEMIGKGLIFRPGTTRPMPSGRQGYVHQLADISLLQTTYTQPELFS